MLSKVEKNNYYKKMIILTKRTFFTSILIALTCVSLLLNGAFVFLFLKNSQNYQVQQTNKKVLDFRNMFTEKVLLSNKDIDFDTRLSLETAVRALNDKEIFSQWVKFTKSQTKEEATTEAKALLELLIRKTSN